MALSQQIKTDLRGKIEPRPPGTITKTGLLKVAEGTVMCKRKEELPRGSVEIEQAESQLAEMEQAFQQQEAPTVNATKKRSKKKVQQVPGIEPVMATINVIGLGSVPSQYAYVIMGENGIAILGLTPMSFIPQATDVTQTPLTNVFQVSTFGDMKFVHMGNTFRTPNGINNLLIYSME